MTAEARLGAEVFGYPPPGCFVQRACICLIPKGLTFFRATKSVQQYVGEGVSLVRGLSKKVIWRVNMTDVTISVYRLSRGFLRVSGGAGRGMGRDSRVAGETGWRVAITIHFTRTKERRKLARRAKRNGCPRHCAQGAWLEVGTSTERTSTESSRSKERTPPRVAGCRQGYSFRVLKFCLSSGQRYPDGTCKTLTEILPVSAV